METAKSASIRMFIDLVKGFFLWGGVSVLIGALAWWINPIFGGLTIGFLLLALAIAALMFLGRMIAALSLYLEEWWRSR